MSPAMCFDGSMLVGLIFFLLIVAVACCTPVVLALIAFARWYEARRQRLAAEAG